MRGEIISHDHVTGSGLISGDDGQRYEFGAADIQSGTAAPGQRVDFAPEAGQATQVIVLAAIPEQAAGLSSGVGTSPEAINWQHLMLSFDGRIRRSHFGIAWLILFGAGFVLGLIPLIGTLVSIALIWPNLAITVKRLHDMGKSGWLAAIPYAVAIVGMIVGFSMMGLGAIMNAEQLENEDPAAVLALIGPAFGVFGIIALVGLGFLLWIGLTPEQPGTNRFGPNPKGE